MESNVEIFSVVANGPYSCDLYKIANFTNLYNKGAANNNGTLDNYGTLQSSRFSRLENNGSLTNDCDGIVETHT